MADKSGQEPIRVVSDCNVMLQALANFTGPAGQCFQLVRGGQITLCVSRVLLAELADVVSRPLVMRMLRLTQEATVAFIAEMVAMARMIDPVAEVYRHPVDPKDTMVVNLAVAASAHVITSRDRHLLSLRDPADPVGRDFMSRFDFIDVLTPVELLDRLRTS